MIFKPSNLFKAKEIYKHLTRQNDTTKQFLKLGTKDIPIPAKKQNVIDIEAVNRFNKANPRDDITNIQPVVKQSTIKQSNAGEVDEGVIQGAFDTATVQARDGGYPPPKYEAFKKRYLKRNMKADGGRIGYDEGSKLTDFVDVQASGSITGKNQVEGAPDGITANNQLINAIIRLDIPLSEKTNFLADYSYGKGRTKYEEGDKELFLDEGGYTDRNVGFGYNQDGEGFGGSVIRNLRTGDDDVKLKFKKTIDFNRLFKADGGMLVQPNADGSRPGYMGKNVMSGSPAQQAENIRRQNESFKKISDLFKNKDYTSLKTKTPIIRIKQGMNDGGGKLNSNQMNQINEAIEGGDKTQKIFAKKLNISQKELLEGVEKSKSKISLEKSEKLSKQMLKKVEFQEKLFKEIVDNPNATIDSMTKKFKVDKKYLVSQSSKLLKNVYSQNVSIAKGPEFDLDSRGKATLKSWLPDDFDTTEKFLGRFANIDGFKKIQAENMGILIKNAYAKTNPKKYADAMKTLTEYNNFKNNLPKGLKVDLDHPLSKVFLKGSGVSPDKLLYVTPVNRDFNRGFKMQMGNRYAKALLQGDKTAIKNIRILADRVGVNIGDVKGSKLDFGTTKFDKNKNFTKEYLANLREQNLVADNLKNLQKTKKGKQLIKDANFKSGQIKKVQKINETTIKKLIASFGGGACSVFSGKKADGGRIGLATGTPNIDDCFKSGRAVINSGKIPVDKADDFAQFLKRAGSLGRNIMRIGIIPEALYVAADSLIRVGMGDTFKEAGLRASDYLLPGDQTKIAEMSKVERIFGQNKANLVGRAIDYKNQLSEISGLEKTKTNLELLSGDGGAFDIIGDTTKESSNIGKQILQKKNELNNKFKISEAELNSAENIQDEAYDRSKANSFFTKLKAKFRDVGQDQSDIETVGMPEKSQIDLNLNMIPFNFRASMLNPESRANLDFSKIPEEELKQYLKSTGEIEQLPRYLNEQKRLQSEFSFPVLEKKFGKEQLYGTQGSFFGETISPTVPRVENSIENLEREAVGQKNKFNSFDRDTSVLGTGLRGFSAASGGIASLTKTIPPESGPTPQGLPYVYNNVKKI